MAQEKVNLDVSSNKNIWLAVTLAVITSITSLGTALITSKNESNDNSKVSFSEADFIFFKQQVKKKLEKLEKEIKKSQEEPIKIFSFYHDSIKKDINDKIDNIEDKLDEKLFQVGEMIHKNTQRSIMCYASLSKQELQKGRVILSIINGEGSNKSAKIILPSHLNKELLVKIKTP